jgi:hypothetical protein
MSVVREMRAQLKAPPRKSGESGFFVALGAIAVLGGGGVAYLMLGHSAPPAAASPEIPAVIPAKPQPQAAASSANRIGRREAAPLAASCFEAGKMFMASAMSDISGPGQKPVRRTPEQTRQMVVAGYQGMDSFLSLDRTVAIAGFLTGKKSRDDGPENSSSVVADFVECIVVRSPQSLCQPDNRAAALAYLAQYVVKAHESVAAIDKMPPMKRFEHEQRNNAGQKLRAVMSALSAHARSGSLMLADFGWTPPELIKGVFAANPMQTDVCVSGSR